MRSLIRLRIIEDICIVIIIFISSVKYMATKQKRTNKCSSDPVTVPDGVGAHIFPSGYIAEENTCSVEPSHDPFNTYPEHSNTDIRPN